MVLQVSGLSGKEKHSLPGELLHDALDLHVAAELLCLSCNHDVTDFGRDSQGTGGNPMRCQLRHNEGRQDE